VSPWGLYRKRVNGVGGPPPDGTPSIDDVIDAVLRAYNWTPKKLLVEVW